jgi:hypothetical protein
MTAPTSRLPKRIRELAEYLVTDVPGPSDSVDELVGWVTDPTFRAFAEEHRDKIRKKLRVAGDPQALRAALAELRVAHRLLSAGGFRLAYEVGGARAGGPDFEVRYRGERAFMLEVTRVRGAGSIGGPIAAKLRQLPAGVANVLVLVAPGDLTEDPVATMTRLRRVADAGDDASFVARGLAGSRDFRTRIARLGAVVVWPERAEVPFPAMAWANPTARIRVPDRALRAIVAALG